MSYIYSNDGKTLVSVPANTVHMIVERKVEVLDYTTTRYTFSTLKTVSFLSPSSLTKIKSDVFLGCYLLTEIDFSNCTSLSRIYSSIFMHCSSLKSVIFPSSLIHFDTNTFLNTSLEMFVVPDSLTYIGTASFKNVKTLTQIDFSHATKLVMFFFNCFEGTSITILDLRNCSRLTTISSYCCQNCPLLNTIYFPCTYGITLSFGSYCFANCTSLEHVYFTQCKKIIPIYASVFSGCEKLILPYNIHYPIRYTYLCRQTTYKKYLFSLFYLLSFK